MWTFFRASPLSSFMAFRQSWTSTCDGFRVRRFRGGISKEAYMPLSIQTRCCNCFVPTRVRFFFYTSLSFTMKLSPSTILLGALACLSLNTANGFSTPSLALRQNVALGMSTMAESGVPPATSEASNTEDDLIPTNLPSDVGMDYIPLATMLATGQLAEADQVRHAYVLWSAPK
jgi:hypothetical protein